VNRAIICADRAFPGDCAGLLRFAQPGKIGASGLTLLRWLMTPIEIVGGIFGLFAVGLIVLLIYKSTLTMHEDDQLFLDTTNSHMQEEQTELLTKVNKLTLPMRVFSIGSGVFLLAFLALLIYQKLNEVQ
jgi:multisubunit Na+/H+ antiporter MnhB subunit